MDRHGRVAFVTGAGRGLGRAVALELARAGWDLALLARTQADLEATAEKARQEGARAEVFPAAIEEAEAVARAFAEFSARFERLDALVHCAGTAAFAPLAEADPATWERVVRVNLVGMFLCCREAVRRMERQGFGQIVNVLSIAAKVAFPGSSAYCAAKWGGLGLTKVLAEEVRRRGIRVTAFCPGSIDTPFWDGVGGAPFARERMLRAEEVAGVIRCLLEQPPGIHTDEMVVLPPEGIL